MTRIVWRRSIRVLTLTGGRLEGTWHDTYIEDRRSRELELGGRACERYDNRSSYGDCGVERICTSRHEGRSPVRDQKRQDRSHRTAQRVGSHQIAAVAAIYALPDGFPPLSNSLPCSRSPSHLLQVAPQRVGCANRRPLARRDDAEKLHPRATRALPRSA